MLTFVRCQDGLWCFCSLISCSKMFRYAVSFHAIIISSSLLCVLGFVQNLSIFKSEKPWNYSPVALRRKCLIISKKENQSVLIPEAQTIGVSPRLLYVTPTLSLKNLFLCALIEKDRALTLCDQLKLFSLRPGRRETDFCWHANIPALHCLNLSSVLQPLFDCSL